MRRIVLLAIVAVIGLLVSEWARAAGSYEELYDITLKTGEMVGSSVLREGGQRSFIFDFSPGRSGVKVGGETPDVDLSELLPSIDTGNPNRDPDLVVVINVKATPQGGDQIAVSCQITQLKRTGSGHDDHGYRIENGSMNQLMELGEPWEFLGGTSMDGNEYFIEMTIEPKHRFRSHKQPSVIRRTVPIEFNYEMYDRRIGDSPIFRSIATVAFDPAADESGKVRFEVPIRLPGSDSSAIHMKISLKDLYVSRAEPGEAPDVDATFLLDRMVITNIVPSKDPNRTEVRDGEIRLSDFKRSISLRRGKKIRIALARQANEALPEAIKEYIEVRSLRAD